VKLHPRFAFQIARLWPRLWHARCDFVYLGFHDYGQRRYAEELSVLYDDHRSRRDDAHDQGQRLEKRAKGRPRQNL
jgi:transposase